MSLKAVSLLGLLVMIAALVTLLLTDSLFGESLVPIAVQVLAFGLMIWARLTFGKRSFHASANPTEGGIVSSGPYRYVRHPIYAAALYFTWAGVFSHLTVLNTALGLCAIAGAVMRIYAEEKLIIERYPEYADYARATKRIVPFIV